MSKKSFMIKHAVFGGIYVVLAIFAIVQAILPAPQSEAVSDAFTTVTSSAVFGGEPSAVTVLNDTLTFEDFTGFLRKMVGHFGLFHVMALFGFLALYKVIRTKKIVIIDLSATILIAGLTEIIQIFVPTRIGSFADVVLDAQGATASVAIILAIISISAKLKKRRHRKHLVFYVIIPALIFSILFLLFNAESPYTRFCFVVYSSICLISTVIVAVTNS